MSSRKEIQEIQEKINNMAKNKSAIFLDIGKILIVETKTRDIAFNVNTQKWYKNKKHKQYKIKFVPNNACKRAIKGL